MGVTELNNGIRKEATNTSYKYKIRLITCWLDRKATRKPLHNKPRRVHEPGTANGKTQDKTR